MKIGIDIRSLMDRQCSGVSLCAFTLIGGILKLDKKNTYKLYYNSHKDILDKMACFDHENVSIINTRYPNKVFNYIMQKGLRWPKIDQLMDVDLFFMPHLNFASFSGNCKKIITVHDLSFLRYKEFFSLRKNIWHKFLNVKKMLKSFDAVIAISENTKRDIVELCGVPEDKVHVVYSGLDRRFKVVSNNLKNNKIREKYNLPLKFILYIGNLEPRKNIEGIIEAYDLFVEKNPHLRDYFLVLAGGRGWKYGNIFKTWQRSKNKKNIHFLGYIDDQDKVFLYNMASLFVFPSFYEGFGFPPLEAFGCGVPVITSASSSLTEVVRDGAVLIDPYNIKEISTAMETVLSDDQLQKKLINKGHQIASSFSWNKTFERYLDIFERLKDN